MVAVVRLWKPEVVVSRPVVAVAQQERSSGLDRA